MTGGNNSAFATITANMRALFFFRRAGKRAWLMLAGLGLGGQLAAAAPLLTEAFNYPAGVLGNNAPWTSPTSLINVTNTSLTFSNLADLTPASLCAAVAPGTTAVSYRSLDAVASGGAVYFSFLINFTTKPGSYYIAGLLQSTNAPPGGATADPLDLIDNTSGTGYKLGIRAKGGTTAYVANALVPMSSNTTYFVVMKYNFANGLAALYLNPPPGGNEPATPDATSTAATTVPDLKYVYLRAGSSTAGNFLVSSLRAATTWSEVTPAGNVVAGKLFFSTPPIATAAGNALPAVTVQLQDSAGNALTTSNVTISLNLNSGTLVSGTVTANTDASGSASFNNLVNTTAGTYSLTASATGFSAQVSSIFSILPAAIHHYSFSLNNPVFVGQPFAVSGTAFDVYSNVVTTDNTTMVTLTDNAGNLLFDANNNGVFGEPGDHLTTLSNGVFNLNARDALAENCAVTVSDANGKSGYSGLITVISNAITANGAMLNAFLDSLQVTNYWLGGTSVNWLTGAAGGSGPNKTAGTSTHCSAFAAAAAQLLGIYLLRPPDASDINLANNQADWFVTNTAGWFAIAAMTNAQHLADAGLLVMASYKSASGSGHIAILRASNRSDADVNATGPEECQSGEYNFGDTNIATGFNQHAGAFPSGIKYFGHTVNYPVGPTWPQFFQSAATGTNFTAGITTIVGRKYQLQWSSNLVNWSALLNFTNANSPTTFYTNGTVSDATGAAKKFYRLVTQ